MTNPDSLSNQVFRLRATHGIVHAPDAFGVERVVTWTDTVAAAVFVPVSLSNHILTEAGDRWLTEAGDLFIQE